MLLRMASVLEKLHRHTVGPDKLPDPHRLRAALDLIASDGHGISGLQRPFVPARSRQLVGSREFTLPLFHLALVVLALPEDLHVGIDELEIRDLPRHGDHSIHVERRRAVVRKQRHESDQKTGQARQQWRQASHRDETSVAWYFPTHARWVSTAVRSVA